MISELELKGANHFLDRLLLQYNMPVKEAWGALQNLDLLPSLAQLHSLRQGNFPRPTLHTLVRTILYAVWQTRYKQSSRKQPKI